MKVANHLGGQHTTPDIVDRSAKPAEAQDILDCTSYLLPGVSDRVLSSVVCLYTRTPDEHFIIDRHPHHPEVTIAAGFSGHGFNSPRRRRTPRRSRSRINNRTIRPVPN